MTAPTARTPLVCEPVAPYDTLPEGDGITRSYGWCAWWCNCSETFQTNGGVTVEDHGSQWCERSILTSDVLMADGTATTVGIDLAKPYRHGMYRREDRQGSDESYVRVGVHSLADDDDERVETYLTPEAARSMAAALIYAADSLERLDKPLRNGYGDRR